MKALIPFLFILPLAAAEPSLSEQLREALYTEEVERQPAKAATTYEKILSDFHTQRPLAATALFRLAEIRRNAGEQEKAIALYQRLLREFPDREAEAKLARQHLAALGGEEPLTDTNAIGEEAAELQRLKKLSETAPDIILDPRTLSIAVEKGWAQVVAYLLEQGCDPSNTSVLYEAAQNGRLDICRLLVEHGVDDEMISGAIEAAVENRRLAVLRFLLDGRDLSGAPPRFHLHQAINRNNLTALELLLDHGADINAALNTGGRVTNERLIGTPLHQAVMQGNMEAFAILLERGAKPDIKAPVSRTTPLHLAVRLNDDSGRTMLKRLLKAGANPNTEHTPVPPPGHGKLPVPKQGTNVLSQPNLVTYHPLAVARLNNHIEAAEILLEAGAKIESSELHRVVEINSLPWVEIYLKNLPRFEPDDLFGHELLDLALKQSHAVAAPLIAHGASPTDSQIESAFPDAPRKVLPHLNEAFLLPKLTGEPRIQLLVDMIGGQRLTTLAESGSSQTPPPLAKTILDAKVTYAQLAEGKTKDRWRLWRRDEAGELESIDLDLAGEAALPDLKWGDVIERRIVDVSNSFSTRHFDALPPELAWSLARRVNFPISVTIDGKTTKFSVRGDRISYDPTVRVLPYLDANGIVHLIRPDIGLLGGEVTVTVRRNDWQDTTMSVGSKALARFMLRKDDQLVIKLSDEATANLKNLSHHHVTLKVNGTSYSQAIRAYPGTSLIEFLTAMHSSEFWSWSRDRLHGYSNDPDVRLGQFFQTVASHSLQTPVVLPQPDFSKLKIHRLNEDGTRSVIEIDLAKEIAACTEATSPIQARSADIELMRGDIIGLGLKSTDEAWTGFSDQQARFFRKVLSGACQVTSSEGEVTRHFLNWQPTRWIQTPAGTLPEAPKDGISCTRIMDLGIGRESSYELLRNGKTYQDISRSRFIRNGDQINAPTKATPRIRRTPVTPQSR